MRKKLTLLVLFIIATGSIGLYSKEKIKTVVLEPVKAITGEKDPRLYVRNYFLITTDDKMNIYVSDNQNGNILKINNRFEYERRFGRKGKGPGDLTHPFNIVYANNNIIVSDDIAFNFFDKKGNYLNRFRKFLPYRAFTADSKYVYTYLPRKKGAITVYDYNGKKIRSFGERFPAKISKKMSFSILSALFRADIFVTKKYIYLLYLTPAIIYKYDKEGNFINKTNIGYDNEYLNKIQEELREIIYKKGYSFKGISKYEVNNTCIRRYVTILRRAYYYKGKLYLLLDMMLFGKSGCVNDYGQIIRYDIETMKGEKKYIFYNMMTRKYGKESIMLYWYPQFHFSVNKKGDSEYFFIPIYDKSGKFDGVYLGIYKTKEKKLK